MKNIINNATIIDVRSADEFAQGHYPNAINIPLDQVPEHITDLKEMKKPLVIYCRSGNRSSMAVSILKQHSITEVYNGGGLDDLMQQVN